jgi:hypothetical protein
MKKNFQSSAALLTACYLLMSTSLTANDGVAYSFHINAESDCGDAEDKECCHEGPRKWHPRRFEDEPDPTYKLEAESAWPSQREDFSDMLFR